MPLKNQLHYTRRAAKKIPSRIRTVKYICKKCGKATILKSAALRHFKKCTKGTWTSGIQPNNLGTQKIAIQFAMEHYNEHRIATKLFNEPSHVFNNLGDRQVKGICTFQVEARKQTDEEA